MNPLENYDVPRAAPSGPDHPELERVSFNDVKRSSNNGYTVSTSESSSQPMLPIYANDNDEYQQPVYVNTEVSDRFDKFTAATDELIQPRLLEVPGSELQFFGQSIARLRKYGSCTKDDLIGVSSSSISSLLPHETTESKLDLNGVKLRRPFRTLQQSHLNHRFSIQSAPGEEIAMGSNGYCTGNQLSDMYDVPRTATTAKATVPPRPSSSSAIATRSFHFQAQPNSRVASLTNSEASLPNPLCDSKIDNLSSVDSLYDVPRNSSRAYVNHMETKYDDVTTSRNRQGNSSSTSCLYGKPGHSRPNFASDCCNIYGSRQAFGGSRPTISITDRENPPELYDLPREARANLFPARCAIARYSKIALFYFLFL